MASSTSLPGSVSAIASTASRVASPWPPDSPFSLRGVSSRGYRSCARSPVFSSLAVAAIRRGWCRGCCRCQAGTAGLPRVEDRANRVEDRAGIFLLAVCMPIFLLAGYRIGLESFYWLSVRMVSFYWLAVFLESFYWLSVCLVSFFWLAVCLVSFYWHGEVQVLFITQE